MARTWTKVFHDDLEGLRNQSFKQSIINCLMSVPTHVLEMPSSRSGRYHPEDELDRNGMCLHIKRCITIGKQLVRMMNMGDLFEDVIVASCILHDSFKPEEKGDGNYDLHPWLAAAHVLKYKNGEEIHDDMIEFVAWCCAFHEGRWTSDNVIAKADERWGINSQSSCPIIADLMHTTDYVASRRDVWQWMQDKRVRQEALPLQVGGNRPEWSLVNALIGDKRHVLIYRDEKMRVQMESTANLSTPDGYTPCNLNFFIDGITEENGTPKEFHSEADMMKYLRDLETDIAKMKGIKR